MRGIIVGIMAEILSILGIAMKEVKRGRLSKPLPAWIHESRLTPDLERFLKTLTGNTEIEDSLEKLDKLTQEEAQMACAEQLTMTHSVDGKVMVVDDRVKGVDDRVKGVEGKVQDVCDDVQDVRGDIQDVRCDLQDVDNNIQNIDRRVQDVDDKLEQANRSLSL